MKKTPTIRTTRSEKREANLTLHVSRFAFHASRKLLVVLLLILTTTIVWAQEDQEGGIENVEIEIVKVKQITMPKASRNFEKIPPRPAEPLAPAMTYDFRTINFAAPDYTPTVKPLR